MIRLFFSFSVLEFTYIYISSSTTLYIDCYGSSVFLLLSKPITVNDNKDDYCFGYMTMILNFNFIIVN
jgi:hypothetical protein